MTEIGDNIVFFQITDRFPERVESDRRAVFDCCRDFAVRQKSDARVVDHGDRFCVISFDPVQRGYIAHDGSGRISDDIPRQNKRPRDGSRRIDDLAFPVRLSEDASRKIPRVLSVEIADDHAVRRIIPLRNFSGFSLVIDPADRFPFRGNDPSVFIRISDGFSYRAYDYFFIFRNISDFVSFGVNGNTVVIDRSEFLPFEIPDFSVPIGISDGKTVVIHDKAAFLVDFAQFVQRRDFICAFQVLLHNDRRVFGDIADQFRPLRIVVVLIDGRSVMMRFFGYILRDFFLPLP